MSGCCLPFDCPDLVKVRLSDGPSDKKLSNGEKMTSRTVVGIGNLILAMTLTNHFVGNLTLSKSEVHALSLLSMAKSCGQSFMFIYL